MSNARTPFAIAAILASTASIAFPDIASGDVTTEFIDPAITDPAIPPVDVPDGQQGQNLGHFLAYDADDACVDRVFLFLAGSGGVPDNYELIVTQAAERGYRAIGLAYQNWPAVRTLTMGSDDVDLPGAIREERLFGVDATDLIDVSPADSVENRVVALLEYLAQNRPGEGWNRFRTPAGDIRWNRFVIAGHSQGAGHAAFLTKTFSLGGTVMFAGPGDVVNGAPASWLLEPEVTPADKQYAFTHVQDFAFGTFQATQQLLGLGAFGGPQNVDAATSEDLSSHILISTFDPGGDANFHSGIIGDDSLFTNSDGSNFYEDAWNYLLDEHPPAEADVNENGIVGFGDLVVVLSSWGAFNASADINCDGTVDFFDVVELLSAWSA